MIMNINEPSIAVCDQSFIIQGTQIQKVESQPWIKTASNYRSPSSSSTAAWQGSVAFRQKSQYARQRAVMAYACLAMKNFAV